MDKIYGTLKQGFVIQEELTEKWHIKEADMEEEYKRIMERRENDLIEIFSALHFMNYSLWHVEDTARRLDVPASVIADCKHRIDVFNQKRNNLIEKADEALISAIEPLLTQKAPEKYNTETLGMAIDRMSIIALKIYHMREQASRSDAGREHRDLCAKKLSQLSEQRERLKQSILDLLDDCFAGRKAIKPYFQHKMYNDPKLNPELYRKS